MASILDKLSAGPVLFDGALGTQLIAAGLETGACPERWNLDHPDRLLDIHRAYAEAGADVICANTFGASRRHLERHGLADRLEEINAAGVGLARRAAGAGRLVAGDLGPSGALFAPMGDAEPAALEDLFAEQIRALVGAGVDLLLIETQVDLREALAAVRAAKGVCGLPVAVTLTFNSTPRGYFTMVGDQVRASCDALAGAGADLVGANCTLVPADMAGLTEQLCAATGLPVLVQPNAGQPRIRGEAITYETPPAQFAGGIAPILAAGARAVGGCCGTGPDTIRALRRLLDSTGT